MVSRLCGLEESIYSLHCLQNAKANLFQLKKKTTHLIYQYKYLETIKLKSEFDILTEKNGQTYKDLNPCALCVCTNIP